MFERNRRIHRASGLSTETRSNLRWSHLRILRFQQWRFDGRWDTGKNCHAYRVRLQLHKRKAIIFGHGHHSTTTFPLRSAKFFSMRPRNSSIFIWIILFWYAIASYGIPYELGPDQNTRKKVDFLLKQQMFAPERPTVSDLKLQRKFENFANVCESFYTLQIYCIRRKWRSL